MTFFLDANADLPRRGPDMALPSNSEGIAASYVSDMRSVDVYNGHSKKRADENDRLAKKAAERIGLESLLAAAETHPKNFGLGNILYGKPNSLDAFFERYGQSATEIALDVARQAATTDPAAWADIDLSEEGIEAKVNEAIRIEDERDAEIIALSPNPVINRLVGGIGAGLSDPVNLALIPLGMGGGSLLRIMGREAMLSAAAEAMQYGERVEFADRIGSETPDFWQSIGIGAISGAVLGGAIEGVPRAIRGLAYVTGLGTPKVPGIGDIGAEAAIRAGESALARGGNPLTEIIRTVQKEPMSAREPLILGPESRVDPPPSSADIGVDVPSVTATTPEPTALAPDPITTESLPPLPGQAPTTPGETAALAEIALNKAAPKAKAAPKNPILTALKRAGGIDPKGTFADELRSMGVTHKSMPGLFKNGGIREGDNLPFTEWNEKVPGLAYRTGDDGSGHYLSRDGLLRAIDDELRGFLPEGRNRARDYDPQTRFSEKVAAEDGFFVNLDHYQFDDPNWDITLGRDLDAYFDRKGITILPREREEIFAVLSRDGGEVEDLVYRVISRDLDEAEQGLLRAMRGDEINGRQPRFLDDIPFGDEGRLGSGADRPGGGNAGESVPAGAGPREGASRPVEPARDGQLAIPDTGPVTPPQSARNRAEIEARQLQSKIRRLDQHRVEDDVNTLFAAKQMDIFDDIQSPQAQSFMDAEVANLRSMLDEGITDISAVADDGRVLNSLQDIIDEIDDSDALLREFRNCRTGGAE